MQYITIASTIMTSRYVYPWKIVKNEKGESGTCHHITLGTPRFHGPWSFRRRSVSGNGATVEPEATR
eukprot:2871330-Pyramimonas_sp.AAC.1